MPLLSEELSKMSSDVFAKTGMTDSYSQILGKIVTDLEDQFKRLGATTGLVAASLQKEHEALLEMQKFENWRTLIQPKLSGMQAYSNIFGGDVQGGDTTRYNYNLKSQASTKYDKFFEESAERNKISIDLLKAMTSGTKASGRADMNLKKPSATPGQAKL